MVTNVDGTFLLSCAAARKMIAQGQGGSIVNISSIASKIAQAKAAAYSASKAAVNALSRSMALDLAPDGIRVNAICPGIIDTFRMDDLGAGERAFSAGADLRDPPRNSELWECMPGVGVPLTKPTIAAVAGHCVGGGVCLVEFCTLAVAADNADFSYPEAQLGFCGGLIAGLAVRIPYKVAMELMLTGAHMKAARAYEVGMVNAVVPVKQRMETAYEYARKLAESAPLVL